MPKKVVLCFLAVVLSAALLLTGCGGGTTTEQPGESSGKASSNQGGEITKLFAKADTVDELYYELIIMEDDREEVRTKSWIKGTRMKHEMTVDDETSIAIFDTAKGEYIVYSEDANKATRTTYDPQNEGQLGPYAPPSSYSDTFEDALSSMKIVGTETYDGHKCKVIALYEEDGQDAGKMWVSEKYGIPLRIVDETSGITIEYKNLKVGSISDDVFKLPAGIEIWDY